MARERETGFEEDDEGQRPRHPLPGVNRLGPEDVSGDEAAAFGAVGAGTKMRRLIEHHRRLFPAADRAMLRRKWDEGRSEALLDHTDALAEGLGIDSLEGVGVRGTNDRTRIITLVTRGENGRAHKSWLPYSILDGEDFTAIKASLEKAANIAEARRRGMVVGMTQTDQSSADVTELQAQVAELQRRLDGAPEADGGGDGGDEPQTVGDIKAAIAAASDEDREALKARIREAELERDEAEQRKGVLDATEPAGD